MRVLKLQLFEAVFRPARGQESARDGEGAMVAVVANDKVKIHPLPGGQYMVDWGDPTIQSGAMTLVAAGDVKYAQVVLEDAEKAKLLK